MVFSPGVQLPVWVKSLHLRCITLVTVVDIFYWQLEDTCLSIWRRLQYLQRMKRPMITSPPSNEHHSPPSSPPASCATPSSPCATPTSSCATPTSPCTPISPQCTPPSSPVHHRSSPQSSPVSSGLPSSPRGSSSC